MWIVSATTFNKSYSVFVCLFENTIQCIVWHLGSCTNISAKHIKQCCIFIISYLCETEVEFLYLVFGYCFGASNGYAVRRRRSLFFDLFSHRNYSSLCHPTETIDSRVFFFLFSRILIGFTFYGFFHEVFPAECALKKKQINSELSINLSSIEILSECYLTTCLVIAFDF